MDRRSVLKMFGIAATAAATAAPVALVEAEAHWIDPLTVTVIPPKGLAYQWKRIFITSEEPDLENILQMIAAGWKPVPLARHRDELPGMDARAYWIESGGLVLMEKPSEDIPPPRAHPVPL